MMTLSRRAARKKMGSRTARRQSTKNGATTVVAGKKVKVRRPRPRSRMAEILRTGKT